MWFLITTVLLILPGPDIPRSSFLDEIYFDKWVHIGLFGGITFLTALPYIKANPANKKLLIKICIIFSIYGILMEFAQKYLAFERSFDYVDMIADGIGCISGVFMSGIYSRKIITQKNKPL